MRPTPLCDPGCADMDWLQASDYWLTRLVIERVLGVIYCVAFLVALNQFRPLLGEKGLLPVPLFLSRVSFLQAPSLFPPLLGPVAAGSGREWRSEEHTSELQSP